MSNKRKVNTTGILLDDLDLFNEKTDLHNNPFTINIFEEMNKLETSKNNLMNNAFPEQKHDFYKQKEVKEHEELKNTFGNNFNSPNNLIKNVELRYIPQNDIIKAKNNLNIANMELRNAELNLEDAQIAKALWVDMPSSNYSKLMLKQKERIENEAIKRLELAKTQKSNIEDYLNSFK